MLNIKKISVLAVLLFVLPVACFAVPPTDAKYYQVYAYNETKLYVDTDSLKKISDRPHIIRFRLYTEESGETLRQSKIDWGSDYDHEITEMLVDLKQEKVTLIKCITYRADGKRIKVYDFREPEVSTDLTPGSVIHRVVANILKWMEKNANQ